MVITAIPIHLWDFYEIKLPNKLEKDCRLVETGATEMQGVIVEVVMAERTAIANTCYRPVCLLSLKNLSAAHGGYSP